MSCSLHTGFLLSIILSCSHIPGFAQFIDDKQKKRVTGRINYERIDARKTFAYYLDLYGHNYETDLFLQDYLKNFDDQYSKYKENEFELKRNQLKAKEEIEAGLREVDFTKVFVEYYGTSFGDYDFDRNMFAFNEALIFQLFACKWRLSAGRIRLRSSEVILEGRVRD